MSQARSSHNRNMYRKSWFVDKPAHGLLLNCDDMEMLDINLILLSVCRSRDPTNTVESAVV